jgi:hypothetical protein
MTGLPICGTPNCVQLGEVAARIGNACRAS